MPDPGSVEWTVWYSMVRRQTKWTDKLRDPGLEDESPRSVNVDGARPSAQGLLVTSQC